MVFCKAGISRSAAICIAYLMQQKRMTMDEAHDYVKSRRTFISPNLNFMRQLHEFDARLRATADAADDGPPTAAVAPPPPLSPSRPVLRSLQCPVVDQRRRWLSATMPTFPVVDHDAVLRRTPRHAPSTPRHVDASTRWSNCSPAVSLSRPAAAAFLSIVSPGFGVGSISAPTVDGERPVCRRDRLSASTPSQMSRRVFVYPLPLNANSSLVSL